MRTPLASWCSVLPLLVGCNAAGTEAPQQPRDSIRVRVIDATSRMPVANATVSYASFKGDPDAALRRIIDLYFEDFCAEADQGRGALERFVRTDEDGVAVLEAVVDPFQFPVKTTVLDIEATCGDRFGMLAVDRPLRAEETIELHPAEHLDVRIVDERGRPVGGFPVRLRVLGAATWSANAEAPSSDVPRPWISTLWHGETDATNGVARVGPLERVRGRARRGSGFEVMLLLHGDHGVVIREPITLVDGASVELRVPEHWSVEIEVVDVDGRPIDGAVVSVDFEGQDSDDGESDDDPSSSGESLSDECTYATNQLSPRLRIVGRELSENYSVEASAPGWVGVEMQMWTPATLDAVEHVRVRLERKSVRLVGRFLDENQRPFDNRRFEVFPETAWGGGFSDDPGRFEVEIDLEAAEGAALEFFLSAEPATPWEWSEITFVPESGPVLRGSIANPAVAPGATVEVGDIVVKVVKSKEDTHEPR